MDMEEGRCTIKCKMVIENNCFVGCYNYSNYSLFWGDEVFKSLIACCYQFKGFWCSLSNFDRRFLNEDPIHFAGGDDYAPYKGPIDSDPSLLDDWIYRYERERLLRELENEKNLPPNSCIDA